MKNKKLAVRIIAVSFAVMAFFAGCSGSGAGSVWIPTNGGTKYHKDKDCSDMINPQYVSLEYAEEHGFEPCQKCY